MGSKVSITTGKVLKWLLLSLAFSPLVVTSMTMFPFVFGKTVFLRVAVALFWILFSVLIFKKGDSFTNTLNLGFLKNPIFVFIASFIFISLVGTIFAPAPYRAFFGTIERGDGLINLLFLGAFLLATVLVFKRRDWFNFLKLTLITGSIVSADMIFDFFENGIRPNGSFIGNPAFVSAYLLFVLFAALALVGQTKKSIWRYAVYGNIVLAITALGIANTRGSLVGLFTGVVAVLVYAVVRGKNLKVKTFEENIDIRRVSVAALVAIIFSTTLFIATINNPFWGNIPGLDRLSEISLEDNTVQSRLSAIGISFDAVNPRDNGAHRLLFGYGPENFNVAYNANYNPSVQKYDILWFDRAHNKLLDVLVMQGVSGLLIYLGIWFFILRFAFKSIHLFSKRSLNDSETNKKPANMLGAAVVFFAVSYFVQNLFVFDQAATDVAVFAFWGFVIHLSVIADGGRAGYKKSVFSLKYISLFLAVLFSFLVVLYSLVPLYQMSIFVSSLRSDSAVPLFENLDSITQPYNFAQPEIRFRILTVAIALVDIDGAQVFIDRAIELEEEVLVIERLEPRYFQLVGFSYDIKARIQNQPELYPKAEGFLREAMKLAPGRQEVRFWLAQNLLSQGRLDESRDLIINTLALEDESTIGQFYYMVILSPIDWDGEYGATDMMRTLLSEVAFNLDIKNVTFIRNSYNSYLKHFFDIRDEEAFLKTMEQSLKIELLLEAAQDAQLEEGFIRERQPIRVDALRMGVEVFKSGGWDAIRLE